MQDQIKNYSTALSSLNAINTSRVLTDSTRIPFGDYVSEGLSVVIPDACFPNMIVGEKANHPWPYLRREINHNWYCDHRDPLVGFLNRDEAVLLYNLALQFRNKPALEIGCWRGWSACHLALAGLTLDVVDPILAEPDTLQSVRNSLAAAGILGNVRLYPTSSPHGVRELANLTRTPWNFFFIDGDHEGAAPVRDVAECHDHAAQDAMFVFHDLASPDVEQGLQWLWHRGWNVLIYQTMQIMGVAWRGDVEPVAHRPDPSIVWPLPAHLEKYPVSSGSKDEEIQRLSRGMAFCHQEISRVAQDFRSLEASLEASQSEIQALQESNATRIHDLARLENQLTAQAAAGRRRMQDSATELNRIKSELKVQGDNSVRLAALTGIVHDMQALFDAAFYLEMNPDVAHAGVDPFRHYQDNGGAEGRDPLLLFDTSYYRKMNPDVADLGINPLMHYVAKGASEGRSPHPLFDSAFYFECNPHVKRLGLNPLLHFLNQGAAEGRSPHPLFDTSYYFQMNPDVAQSGINPLHHYLNAGAMEGRNPHPLFDASFYRERNPAVREMKLNPLLHYLAQDASALGDPHPLFSVSFYRDMNPEIVSSGMNPLNHYLTRGAAEGRNPHPLFNTSYYYENNLDIAQLETNPLVHYVTRGAAEGRDPHPLFDSSFFLESNPDLAQAGVNPLAHYAVFGAQENRDPHPLFDTSFYWEQKPHVRSLGIHPLVHFLEEGPCLEFDPYSPRIELSDSGICIVTPDVVGPVKNGGIGTACYHFARVLAEAGHAVTIFYAGDLTDCRKAHWRNAYSRFQIKFVAMSDTDPVEKRVIGSNWFYERSWRIFEYLRQADYSTIHFQDWHANGFWSIKAKQVGLAFEKTTLTVMTHSCTSWINEGMQQFGADPLETAKLSWAEAYCMEHCDQVFSPSLYMIEWIREKGIRLPERTLLTPYVWSEPASETHGGLRVDNRHLIFFGRLETRKGLHIFCDALRQLQQEGCELPERISFLGKHASVQGRSSGDYLEEFKRELPAIEICIFNDFDYLQAVSYIRNSGGLVVICSIMDNFPFTVIESIQNRLPFIAASTGGIPEMVDSRVSFDPTSDALANCLKARSDIKHGDIHHIYSPSRAARIWSESNAELVTRSSEPCETENSLEVKSSLPTVSICIPYFNHARYLETLLAAFARQSYPAFEVVLVNDGSGPSASSEFNRQHDNNRDVRFKFSTNENQGPGKARNCAAEASKGDLLLFFDADNYPKDTEFVGTLVRAIQHSGADCVTVPYDIVGPEALQIKERDVVATYRPTGPCLEAGFFENILGDSTMIITRTAFEQIGGFPVERDSWEDHELLLKLCFSGLKLETLPETAYFYRQNPAGRNQRANKFLNYRSLFERLKSAKSVDLARIIAAVGAPMMLARHESASKASFGQ